MSSSCNFLVDDTATEYGSTYKLTSSPASGIWVRGQRRKRKENEEKDDRRRKRTRGDGRRKDDDDENVEAGRRRHDGPLNSDLGARKEEGEEDRETEDDEKVVEGKTEMLKDLLNNLAYVLKSAPSGKVEAVDGDTRGKVIHRYRRDTVLDGRSVFVLNGSHTSHIRHPINKLHHRNFDAMLPMLLREKKVKEEKEKEMKMSRSIPDRHSKEIHHGNFEEEEEGKERKMSQSIPNSPTKEIRYENNEGKERKIMKSIAKTDHGERKAGQTMNSKLASSHLHEAADDDKRNGNRTIILENWEQGNSTGAVKMTMLTSLDLELSVLLAFISLVSLAVVTVMYACYFCMVFLRKRERKKSQLFTLT